MLETLKKGEKRYVQVAYLLTSKKVIEREIRSLQKIRDSYQKVIISLDDFSFGNKEGIRHLRPWEIDDIF